MSNPCAVKSSHADVPSWSYNQPSIPSLRSSSSISQSHGQVQAMKLTVGRCFFSVHGGALRSYTGSPVTGMFDKHRFCFYWSLRVTSSSWVYSNPGWLLPRCSDFVPMNFVFLATTVMARTSPTNNYHSISTTFARLRLLMPAVVLVVTLLLMWALPVLLSPYRDCMKTKRYLYSSKFPIDFFSFLGYTADLVLSFSYLASSLSQLHITTGREIFIILVSFLLPQCGR